ncbi:MAG: 4'-phosphopantetheinyl transferase superfamily protein [Vicinamibacteria bacterium]|nr:4'-phosphopantetheinyl transferase superfamily protein [Vicinamibacteria bacterium]
MAGPMEVDVVHARLDDFPDLARFHAVLTDDERSRAAAYKVREPGKVFVLARGCLRLELGRRLGMDARDIRFDVRPSGKPDVRREDASAPDWRFSVSHTGPLVVIAFALGADVGIDIERLDRDVRPLVIAERYFTPREREALRSTPDEGRATAFLAGWTRKEAIVKARGLTMAESLDTLSVDVDPAGTEPAHEDDPRAPARAACRLTAFLLPDSNLIGAAALCGDVPPRLRFRVLSGGRFD